MKCRVSWSAWGNGHCIIFGKLQKSPEYFRHFSKVVEIFFGNADKMHTKVPLLRLRKREQFFLLQKKFDPRLFIGSLLGSRQSAIGQSFSLSLVTIPELFAKVHSAEFQDPGLRLTDQSMAWSGTRALSMILFFLHKPVRYKHYIRYLRPLVFKTRTTTSNAKQCARMNQRHFGGKTW